MKNLTVESAAAKQLAPQIPPEVKAAIMQSVDDSNKPTADDRRGRFHEESGPAGRDRNEALMSSFCRESVRVLSVTSFMLCLVSTVGAQAPAAPGAAGPEDLLPVVVAGQIPTYPAVPLATKVTGTVTARVRTDGTAVASVDAISGPPLLFEYLKATLMTCEFAKHDPTFFETAFTFSIEEPGRCTRSNSNLVLRLPPEVVVTTRNLLLCDPTGSRPVPAAAPRSRIR